MFNLLNYKFNNEFRKILPFFLPPNICSHKSKLKSYNETNKQTNKLEFEKLINSKKLIEN